MRVNYGVMGMLVALAPLVAGCATKGDLRRAMDEQRTALEAERSARAGADSGIRTDVAALRTDVEALRSDLQGLRTEFNAQITALEEGVQFIFPVHFAFDEAELRMEDEPALQRFAEVIQRHYNGSEITVEGFADPAGSAEYNRALSQRRAESVRSYLLSHGLDGELVRPVGYGEARLVVPGAWGDDAGAESNRRVVFVIESKGNPQLPGIALIETPE
ncbi:MAG: OmpA family protein, partial [Gemmatimonadaceae bacterium]